VLDDFEEVDEPEPDIAFDEDEGLADELELDDIFDEVDA
jgi:hypothetical protein